MKRVLIALMVVAFAACGPAFLDHPLIPLSEAIVDERLVGEWCDADESEGVLTFALAPAPHPGVEFYEMTFNDDDMDELEWRSWLGRIGDELFINILMTSRAAGSLNETRHLVGRIWIEGDRFRVALLDETWAEAWATAMGDSFWEDRDGIVVTAPTPALQWIARRFADDDSVFSEDGDYVRASPAGGCETSENAGGI